MVRCEVCQHVHTVEFRPPPPRNLPFILSEGPKSERVVLVVDADGQVAETDEGNNISARSYTIVNRPPVAVIHGDQRVPEAGVAAAGRP